MHLADAFIQSDLQCIQAIHLLSVCVPRELNPQPFALLLYSYIIQILYSFWKHIIHNCVLREAPFGVCS